MLAVIAFLAYISSVIAYNAGKSFNYFTISSCESFAQTSIYNNTLQIFMITIFSGANCAISTKYKIGDLKEPQPLLLKQVAKNATIWYPDDDNGTLSILADDSIYLACPGKQNYLKNRRWGNEAKVICIEDKVFDVNEARHNFSSLVCKSHPEHYAQHTGSPPCLDKHSPIEIGFNVSGTFIRTIELCRDDKTYTTYYTKFKMSKMIESYQKSYPR